jgi:hypothetical protein
MIKTLLMLCVLLSTVAIAGKMTESGTAAPWIGAVCRTDCLVTGSGFTAGKSYSLEIVDKIKNIASYHAFTASNTGTFSYTLTRPAAGVWSFYVFSLGRNGSLGKRCAAADFSIRSLSRAEAHSPSAQKPREHYEGAID